MSDFDKLAKQFGGEVDYDAMAKQVKEEAEKKEKLKRSIPSSPDTSPFFPGLGAKRAQARVSEYSALESLQTAQFTHQARFEMTALKLEHEQELLPTRLHDEEELRKAAHQKALTESEATRLLTERAFRAGMTVEVFGQLRLEQEKLALRIMEARALSEVKVQETEKLDNNRLATYKKEIQADFEALSYYRMLPHAIVLGLGGKLQELFFERDDIAKRTDLSQQSRKRMLKNQDRIIKGFEEDLRVQMARHLSKEGGPSGISKDDEATDSPSGD